MFYDEVRPSYSWVGWVDDKEERSVKNEKEDKYREITKIKNTKIR